MKVLSNFRPLQNGKFKLVSFTIDGKDYVCADEPVCIYDTNKDYGSNPTYILMDNSIIYEIITQEEYAKILEYLEQKKESEE